VGMVAPLIARLGIHPPAGGGDTNCQPHSAAALGYLRVAKACGKAPAPIPLSRLADAMTGRA
jgi:hypothetical protein